MNPLVSVIIPLYNSVDSIKTCIESIESQTYTNIEVVIIDDGSLDNSYDVCSVLTKQYKNIILTKQNNKGVSAARNRGLTVASGEYITFVDSDDAVDRKYVEILVRKMNRNGMTACSFDVFDSDIPIVDIGDSTTREMSKSEAEKSVYSSRGMSGFVWGKLFDARLIKNQKIKFDENIAICEDLLFCIAYLSVSSGIYYFMDCPLYHYKANEGGALIGRYNKPNKKYLTEYKALQEAKAYTEQTAIKAWTLRTAKAAITNLRMFVAYGLKRNPEYDEMLRFARTHLISYLISNDCERSSKISMILGCLSPKLEYRVWKSQYGK